jgi:hypothetical protein
MRRSFSRQDSLPRYPEQLVHDPAPLVPPLDLGGRQRQQQQQQLMVNTRAFSKDPQYAERSATGHRNPAYAADGLNGHPVYPANNNASPASYYPRIKDSLSLARARLDAALADDERMFDDDIDGDVATAVADLDNRRLDVGWGGGGGVVGLQQALRGGGGPQARDSIEIYRDQQQHYLQVKTTCKKTTFRNVFLNLLNFCFRSHEIMFESLVRTLQRTYRAFRQTCRI